MKRVIWDSSPTLNEAELLLIREEICEREDAAASAFQTEDEIMDYYLTELNPSYLEDEQANLDIQLPGKVIAIADLGLWYGRRTGYRVLDNNLNCVLQSHVDGMSEICIYGDSYNIRADEAHHDGMNHYLYRMLCPDKDATPLLNAIYANQPVSRSMLNRYTRSLFPYVAKVFGWPCRKTIC